MLANGACVSRQMWNRGRELPSRRKAWLLPYSFARRESAIDGDVSARREFPQGDPNKNPCGTNNNVWHIALAASSVPYFRLGV